MCVRVCVCSSVSLCVCVCVYAEVSLKESPTRQTADEASLSIRFPLRGAKLAHKASATQSHQYRCQLPEWSVCEWMLCVCVFSVCYSALVCVCLLGVVSNRPFHCSLSRAFIPSLSGPFSPLAEIIWRLFIELFLY